VRDDFDDEDDDLDNELPPIDPDLAFPDLHEAFDGVSRWGGSALLLSFPL
jgi:hypothetical protein